MVHLANRIPDFIQLDDTTSIYQPPSHNENNNDNAAVPRYSLQNKQTEPELIVLCSWMSARPKHIAKYTAGYQKLFPNATILLIEAKLSTMLSPPSLAAAQATLTAAIEAKPPLAYRASPSIILHASSNGGANNAVHLTASLKRAGYGAPFDAIVLDCSPGKAEFAATVRAVVLSLPPNPVLRGLSTVPVWVMLVGYFLYVKLLRREDVISRIRSALNDRAVFGVNVPRSYLYSKADRMVETRHVHEHAAEAGAKGCGEVREEVFERAPHCALIGEDGGRYWGAVERVARSGIKHFAESRWA